MNDPMALTDAGNWSGGFYELALEVGDRDDERLQRALTALWRAAAVTGCYGDRDREPADQVAVPVTVASLEEFGSLRGVAQLPLTGPVVCGCFATRIDDAEDWLTLYLPLGALARADRRVGGFPFGPDAARSLTWRAPLDAWLAGVADEVFREVDFRLGLIGFLLDHVTAAELAGGLPDERWNGYLLPTDGRLAYTPANR